MYTRSRGRVPGPPQGAKEVSSNPESPTTSLSAGARGSAARLDLAVASPRLEAAGWMSRRGPAMEHALLGSCPGCGAESSTPGTCPHCGAVAEAEGYRMEQVLWQMPHSRMYLARGPDGGRVALKELLFSLAPGVEEVDAFERESRLLRQLTHPRIPKYLASFQVGSGPATRFYLAQEYVSGEPLATTLERGPVGEAEARDVLHQVLEVLVYLHGQQPPVLHRDIKPQNLIRTADGAIHLVDFGAARDLSRGTTHGATLVGTFGYMPIEQLGGTASPASDLFALGATVLHLLTGRHPAELMTEGYTLRVGGNLPVSPRFRRYLEKLVARERSGRFGTAREALAALDALETAGPSSGEAALVGRAESSVRGLIPKPERLHVEDTDEGYSVWWSSRGLHHFLLGFFAVQWLAFSLISLTATEASSPPLPFTLLMFLVGLAFAYNSLAGLLNKTRLQLTRDVLEMTHGPVSLRRDIRLDPREVTHLCCARDTKKVGPNLDTWPTTFNATSYSLHAVVGDRKVRLVGGFAQLADVLWLKRAFEERLGLPDRPHDGELG